MTTEADRERAAVVAWLRETAALPGRPPVVVSTLTHVADRIERGDHLKGKSDE